MRRVLNLGGLAVAIVVAIPVILDHRGATTGDVLRWLVVLTLAQTAMLLRMRALQTVATLLLLSLPPCFGLEGALLMIVALQLGFERSRRVAIPWVAAQSVAMFLILWWHWNLKASLVVNGAYVPFQFLALFFASTMASLAAAEERARIARDLHDVLGHHLVALSLNLELAAATEREESLVHIGKAQALAAALLDDVRATVHALRTETNVIEALHAIAAQTPRPEVHVETPAELDAFAPGVAETIVRCAQELVTNAAKHSGADHLWLTLRRRDARLELHARDDGRGAAAVGTGGGIDGMDKRLRRHGGGIVVRTEEGRGFSVTAWVPCP